MVVASPLLQDLDAMYQLRPQAGERLFQIIALAEALAGNKFFIPPSHQGAVTLL